ncbi:trypsin-like peptidase domain-containing protein [Kitasatospora sp. NPDC056273]|uniref:trypsin-like peptidase domain-containing protein n=1 Tax=Kitasatospora sp. NPDC056273 TaxID=3345769 RepID=UPI0035DC7046
MATTNPEPRTTHFLDSYPFRWTDPGAVELRDLLASVHFRVNPVLELAQQAGIAPAEVNWDQPMSLVWFDLITVARKQEKLRPLLDRIAAGPDQALAARVRELLAARPVLPAPEPELPSGTWAAFRDPDEQERQIFRASGFQDVAFLRRGAELATAVCRLLVTHPDGQACYGTAFRIGPDLLLTNHHVLYSDDRPAEAVEAWFGYEQDLDGRELRYRTVRCDPATAVGRPEGDWAVIRTADPLPEDALVVPIPDRATVAEGDRVCIIQHPHGLVKKLAARHNVVRHVDEQVVQYWTDTEYGSSGAPVFDERWRLVALHRGHVRIGQRLSASEFRNEGLRIERVAEGLAAAGVR